MDTTFKHAWGEFKPDEEEFLVQLGGKIRTYANDQTLEEHLPESESPGVVAEKCKKIKEVALKHEAEKQRRQEPYVQMQGRQLRDLRNRYTSFYEDTRKRLFTLYGNVTIAPTERFTEEDIVDTLHTIETDIPPESTFDIGAQTGQYEDRITRVFERAVEQTFRKKYEARYTQTGKSITSDEQSGSSTASILNQK